MRRASGCAAGVRAVYVRDAENAPRAAADCFYFRPPSLTDDRGVYRIFGWRRGLRVAVGGGPSEQASGASLTKGKRDIPSTTRAGRTRSPCRAAGGSGIDIRYRGEARHTIAQSVRRGELAAYNSSISLS